MVLRQEVLLNEHTKKCFSVSSFRPFQDQLLAKKTSNFLNSTPTFFGGEALKSINGVILSLTGRRSNSVNAAFDHLISS
jgi:hypothetical protein